MADKPPQKKNRMRNLFLFLFLLLALACCGLYSLGGSTLITSSSRPSGQSSLPTQAPVRFDPIRLNGRGDDIVTLDKPDAAAIIHLTHSGSANFIVTSYDGRGNSLNLLVNVIGAYDGTRPLDFADSELTERLEIQADGAWSVAVEPLANAQAVRVPTTNLFGQGDTVLRLSGGSPDTASLTHSGESNFIVTAYGRSRRLLVNEIGNYEGTVIVPGDTAVLEIEADGDWQLSMTGQ